MTTVGSLQSPSSWWPSGEVFYSCTSGVLGQFTTRLITDVHWLGLVRCVVKVLAIMCCHGATSVKELVCVCVYSPQLVWSLSDAPHNHLFTLL